MKISKPVVFYSALLLAAIAAVTLGVRNRLGHTRRQPTYEAREREAQARGLPVDLADIAPGNVRPAQNAAPLYLAMIDGSRYPDTHDEDLAVKLALTHQVTPPPAWQTASRFVANSPALIATVDEAAGKPTCVVSHALDNPAAIRFPELAQMRRAATIVTVESLLQSHAGKPVDAVRNQVKGFTIARHAKTDLGLILSNFMGLACDEVTLNGLQKILIDAHGNVDVATAVDSAVAQQWSPTDPAVAISHEAAYGNSEIHYLQAQGPQALPSTAGVSMTPQSADWKTFIDANGAYYLGVMEQAVDASRSPYPQSIPKLKTIENQLSGNSPDHVLAKILYPAPEGYCAKCLQISAKAAVTRAACSVFLYKAKHGQYPSSIADAAAPVTDPYTGRLLDYRRVNEGFVISSAGPVDNQQQPVEHFQYP